VGPAVLVSGSVPPARPQRCQQVLRVISDQRPSVYILAGSRRAVAVGYSAVHSSIAELALALWPFRPPPPRAPSRTVMVRVGATGACDRRRQLVTLVHTADLGAISEGMRRWVRSCTARAGTGPQCRCPCAARSAFRTSPPALDTFCAPFTRLHAGQRRRGAVRGWGG
jgi:hypothetical protein